MNRLFQRFTAAVSTRKGAKITLIVWLVLAILLSGLIPGARQYATNVNGQDLPKEAESVLASKELERYFPDEDGTPALMVFHCSDGMTSTDIQSVEKLSRYLHSNKAPETIDETPPFHQMPEAAQKTFLSDDKTTLLLPVVLQDGLEMEAINQTVTDLRDKGESFLVPPTELTVTGPAGIASDTIAIFSNADMVLLLCTIGLILILLIAIYRSPLLAVIPLLVSGIVYQVLDRLLGLAGKQQWFAIDSQALSIASILLFAALTDYSLFVFSRFREELKRRADPYEAMGAAMKQVWEPIFFSGGTVLAAMLVLFTADYQAYLHFAPIFSITMAIILTAGLTLVPSLFVLCGRKAFWPSIPRLGDPESKSGSFWSRVGRRVVRKPGITAITVAAVLALFATQMSQIQYSFNLIQSFPEEMDSRVGFEWLEEHYSEGELAPTTVLLTGSDKMERTDLRGLKEELEKQEGVKEVTIAAGNQEALSDDGTAARMQLLFKGNPYDQETMDHLERIRAGSEEILQKSGLSPDNHQLQFIGETAKQVDVRTLNDGDTRTVILLVTLLITVLLALQTRSLVAPIYMMGTILLSYGAAMGLSYWIFDHIFGLAEISYRIPLYTFVFLVALGVDYNIMLVSRIREEMAHYELREAVSQGVSRTGGVISSAGVILAATFSVLMTQPIMELFLFGFTVALGIMMDTFLVRGWLLPSIITLLGRASFWPARVVTSKGKQVQS